MPLDENLAALLVVPVSWQHKTGLDGNGQDEWAEPVTLKCYPAYGSKTVQKRDGTVYESTQVLYFDANDPNVAQFELGDRFTSVGVAGGITLEAVAIAPEYSPGPSLNAPMQPWLVEVTL